jgi:hypothetical protein
MNKYILYLCMCSTPAPQSVAYAEYKVHAASNVTDYIDASVYRAVYQSAVRLQVEVSTHSFLPS